MHFFPCKEGKFQKIFNGFFSSWLQFFSSSHLSHRQWNGNKAKSLIYYNDWIQTVENMDKPLNEWMNEKKRRGKTSAIEVSPYYSPTPHQLFLFDFVLKTTQKLRVNDNDRTSSLLCFLGMWCCIQVYWKSIPLFH